MTPLRAKTPYAPLADDHCINISARSRALSRFPEAKRWTSALSNAPSAALSISEDKCDKYLG